MKIQFILELGGIENKPPLQVLIDPGKPSFWAGWQRGPRLQGPTYLKSVKRVGVEEERTVGSTIMCSDEVLVLA